MTVDECHRRAAGCAANASIATNEAVASEFLTLAAQWRAMAVGTIFLGSIDAAMESPAALPPRLG